jgi:hypothetical protein
MNNFINKIVFFSLSFQVPFQSMRTHIIKKNSHPIYDELFEFPNVRQINNKLCLLFTILTYDTFTRDEILGQVEFPIILPDGITPNALESTETTFTREITSRHKQVKQMKIFLLILSKKKYEHLLLIFLFSYVINNLAKCLSHYVINQ